VVVGLINARQSQGSVLMLTALALLVVPGILVNNLQANGLVNNSGAMLCSNDICTLTNPNPCTLTSNPCSLSGSSFSILNPCSTWTNILTLNFIGFAQSLFGNCGMATSSQGQFTNPGAIQSFAGNYTFKDCYTVLLTYPGASGPVLAPRPRDEGAKTNDMSVGDAINVGGGQTASGSIASINMNCYELHPSIVVQAGTISVSNSSTPQNIVVQVGTSGATNCPQSNWNGVIGNTSAGSVPTATGSCLMGYIVSGGVYTYSVTFTASCWTYGDYGGTPFATGNLVTKVICTSLASTGAQAIPTALQVNVSTFAAGGLIGFLLALIGGALVLVLALGVGGQAGTALGGVGLTTNPQGTKMAQTFGIGMLIWFPLYSEFSTWFTSGYLPIFNNNNSIQTGIDGNLLNGQVGIISIILTIMFFIGLYFLSQSGTAASQ
jgi:hypothetical protein